MVDMQVQKISAPRLASKKALLHAKVRRNVRGETLRSGAGAPWGWKPSARLCEGRLRGLIEPAKAGFAMCSPLVHGPGAWRRFAVGLKPSATLSEGRLRGLIEPAKAGFAACSPLVYGPGNAR